VITSNADDRYDYDRSASGWRPFLPAPGRERFADVIEIRRDRRDAAIATIIADDWPPCDVLDVQQCLARIARTLSHHTREGDQDFVTMLGQISPRPGPGQIRLHSTLIRTLIDPTASWGAVTMTVDRICRGLISEAFDRLTVYDALHLRTRTLHDPESIHPGRRFGYVVQDRFASSHR
jgi:hypothetical protein